MEAAQRQRPSLQIERLHPIIALLRVYREQGVPEPTDPSPLAGYLPALRSEVEALESWAEGRGSKEHENGAVIRQALGFLRTFGRIMSLEFSTIPIEERDHLVAMLALEHRWCYAAAGTTRDAFKIAIGRTGAR